MDRVEAGHGCGVAAAVVLEQAPQRELAAAFAAHGRFVFRVVRRLGVADAALDDVVQDVFLVAHRKWGSYQEDASMKSWLFGIARRVASHHRRSTTRAERRQKVAPPPNATPCPEDQAARRQAAQFLASFLETLDDTKREVFVACCVEGMTVPEVAVATDAKLPAVYSRLRAAKAKFEAAMQDHLAAEGTR
ncbi:MAG: sigma-70 family RNA polymerase sigma factor [Nannocystaceae bacterium]|nr:sigma-70 family RNA polymerase sigma factor [Nannocystaceae bacterium]